MDYASYFAMLILIALYLWFIIYLSKKEWE